MFDRDTLLRKVTLSVLFATYAPLREGIPSRQLRTTLQSALGRVGRNRGEAFHFLEEEWARVLHDGRGPVTAKPGGYLVFTDDPDDDPRLDPPPIRYRRGLGERPSLRSVVTQEQFERIRDQAAEGRGWVFTKAVGPAAAQPFFSQPDEERQIARAAERAGLAVLDREMRKFSRRRSSTTRF